MKVILVCLGCYAYRRMRKKLKTISDAGTRTRYLIILNLNEGMSPPEVAAALKVSRSSVYRVLHRFKAYGEAGLEDGRRDNGSPKVDEDVKAALYETVAGSPQDYGWPRPTWTLELLQRALASKLGVRLSLASVSRALAAIGARRGRPKPTVECPWPAWKKRRKLAEIKRLLDTLPPDEELYYEDEVDIPLNPKIGLDWMVSGQQKEVPTPGKNEKRYLAGALNIRTGEIVWAEKPKKNSELFLWLLGDLVDKHPHAKKIHVILDNYSIHDSVMVRRALATARAARLVLHFLPPYCPDHNKIERVWQDLHAAVTRNHRCPTMKALMHEVRKYLRRRNRQAAKSCRQAA